MLHLAGRQYHHASTFQMVRSCKDTTLWILLGVLSSTQLPDLSTAFMILYDTYTTKCSSISTTQQIMILYVSNSKRRPHTLHHPQLPLTLPTSF